MISFENGKLIENKIKEGRIREVVVEVSGVGGEGERSDEMPELALVVRVQLSLNEFGELECLHATFGFTLYIMFSFCGLFNKKKSRQPNERPSLPELFRRTPKQVTPLFQIPIQPFLQALGPHRVDFQNLRRLAWNGVPNSLRARVWRMLLHYQPTASGQQALKIKRQGYCQILARYQTSQLSEEQLKVKRLIHGDVVRTCPDNPLFKNSEVQKCLYNVLFAWHFRNPASGYTQGISDVTSPFLIVFLQQKMQKRGIVFEQLSEREWKQVQADIFWCLSKVLEHVQDNYTRNFNGVRLAYKSILNIIRKLDQTLYLHLQNQKIDFFCVTLRQITTLLIRVFHYSVTPRLFDTYLAQDHFPTFVLYLLAAIYLKHSNQMLLMNYEGLMRFLQRLPSVNYSEAEMTLLLSEAYVYSCSTPL